MKKLVKTLKFISNYIFFYIKNLELIFEDKNNEIYKLKDNDNYIFSYSLVRLRRFYRRGINSRLDRIFKEYLLDNLIFEQDELIIDVGANIGELYLSFFNKKIDINYIGIEPSPSPYKCLEKNAYQQTTFNVALSDKNNLSKLYIDDESADTSLINNINNNYFYTNVTTLDTLVKEKKLIKLNY